MEISGVHISNPETLNSLNKPTLGGYLYDPVMGSMDEKLVNCMTCNLHHHACPAGIYGHIKPPLPVYHPFPTLARNKF